MIKLLRFPAVKDRTGDPHSTLYLRIAQGLMPPPVKSGPNSSAWPDIEIDAVVAARVSGKSEIEIKRLVSDMVAARKNLA